jgi:hypothetical protein
MPQLARTGHEPARALQPRDTIGHGHDGKVLPGRIAR